MCFRWMVFIYDDEWSIIEGPGFSLVRILTLHWLADSSVIYYELLYIQMLRLWKPNQTVYGNVELL